jgi:hypothetical protein
MGQPVAVVEKPSASPGIVRFESNRTLTGMGHERFASAADAFGPRPAAELARRLFATGKVAGVHIYANVITVELIRGEGVRANDSSGLVDVVRDLHKYWMPGMEPPSFDEGDADAGGDTDAEQTASGGAGGDAVALAGGDAAAVAELSEAAKRVPPDLLERSRLARERWKAKQG